MQATRRAARRQTRQTTGRRSRKATYSLPVELLERLERASGTERAKSRIVAEALALYFARQEREDLEAQFTGAGADAGFVADNQAVLGDFACLEAERERRKR